MAYCFSHQTLPPGQARITVFCSWERLFPCNGANLLGQPGGLGDNPCWWRGGNFYIKVTKVIIRNFEKNPQKAAESPYHFMVWNPE